MSDRIPRARGARRTTTSTVRTRGRAGRFAIGLLVVIVGWGLGNAPVHSCSGLGIDTFFCSCDHASDTTGSHSTSVEKPSCCAPATPKAPRGKDSGTDPDRSCCQSKAPTLVDTVPPLPKIDLDDLPLAAWLPHFESAIHSAVCATPRLSGCGPGDRSPPAPAHILYQRFLS